MEQRVVVYIWGNKTVDNFTPRVCKDTMEQPGQQPGLSAWDKIPPGRKAQGIDIGKLGALLRAIPDDPESGGEPGHFTIAPINELGELDREKLEDWAMTRGTERIHELTRILLDAVTQPNAKGAKP